MCLCLFVRVMRVHLGACMQRTLEKHKRPQSVARCARAQLNGLTRHGGSTKWKGASRDPPNYLFCPGLHLRNVVKLAKTGAQ